MTGPEAQYRDFLNTGQFMLQRSKSSGRYTFYPRIAVLVTGGRDLSLRGTTAIVDIGLAGIADAPGRTAMASLTRYALAAIIGGIVNGNAGTLSSQSTARLGTEATR